MKIFRRPEPRTAGQPAAPAPVQRPSRRLYLVATSGHPNYGDELILRRWLELLARTEPDAEVWVDCPAPGPTATLMAGVHPGLRTTDTLWRLCWDAPGDGSLDVADFVVAALDDPGRAPRWVSGIELLRTVDVLHVLGGGYINSVWPRHLGLVAGAAHAAERAGARLAATGLGLLPADDDARAVWKEHGPRFDLLGVRDAESLEAVGSYTDGARLLPDDVFLGGARAVLATSVADAPGTMVCVQTDLYDGEFGRVVDLVRATVAEWSQNGRGVGFVECIPRVDRGIYDALVADFPQARFYSLWDLLADGFPARPGQRWLTSRYHPHLLAAAAGASGVALNLRPGYYDVKHGAVQAAGSGWSVVGPDATGPLEPGPAGRLQTIAPDHARALGAAADEIYARA